MTLNVLLVDDNASLRDCLDLWLTQEEAHVTAVKDGQEAIELLCEASAAFDVVISDVDMPRVNGWSLLAWVQQHDTRLPVVLMSGGQPSQFINTAKASGACGALPKPFEMGWLRALLIGLSVRSSQPRRENFYCPVIAAV